MIGKLASPVPAAEAANIYPPAGIIIPVAGKVYDDERLPAAEPYKILKPDMS